MKIQAFPLSALVLAIAALPLGAQTSTMHHTVHHATEHHTTMAGGCVKVPELSPKIPALPASDPCPRALYTLTHTPDIHLDYASPLVSPELRAELSQEKTTYSLVYVDTEIGTGPLAQPGKYYTVHYTGYLTDGTKFDSSVDRGKPITFPYGKHRVIEGWDTAFEGMHVGGKRRLFIPYQLAYGEAGRPPVIPAKAELVFDIEFIAQGDQMPSEQPPAMRHPEPMHPATPPPTAKPTTPPQPTKPQQ
ncbi:MAG: FKBP-type peptidyl-prolyl cis-trans isomerase [Acidobacteriaceae bacterium]